ncbi:unnamed protein product [Microthlaspi erraticum]|uniref:F-box domain-containing protein n=1 Tax=Microthlaspi erraticum TaxID=1685480 RepID=A0A6D2IF58_9BRAS|nr:unnamed protein product [Microthlaspi erraticum]
MPPSSSTNLSSATNSKESSSPLNLSNLPNDLLLNCLARVSRLYYPILSLVSKRFRSVLASLELYDTRTLLSRTETCLYVCFQFGPRNNLCWFTLSRRPTRVPNPNPNPKSQWFTPCFRPFKNPMNSTKSSGNHLVSVPTTDSSRFCKPLYMHNLTTIGSKIYSIAGHTNGRMFFIDCRSNSHTWHEAPSMRRVQRKPRVSVIDGKIYVVEGSSRDVGSSIEVFDPKTQTWEDVPSPGAEMRGKIQTMSLAMEGNLYLFGDKTLVYKPKDNRWYPVVGLEMDLRHRMCLAGYFDCYCEVDNVMYFYGLNEVLEWYDSEKQSWKFLKGLEKDLPRLPTKFHRVY